MRVRFLSAAVALLVSVSAVMAQDVTGSAGAGSKALLFNFNGLANLGAATFNGGIGAKYFLTSAIAVRAAVGTALANQELLANPGVGQTGIDGSRKATQFGVSLAGEYHFLTSRVSPYVGAGFGFSSTTTESKNSGSVTPPAVFTQTTTKNALVGEIGYLAGTSMGINLLTGVEYFITKELSLGGEYQLGYASVTRPDQEIITANSTLKTSVGNFSLIGISTTALTLSVYF